ncbi:MAG: DUF748 domain-containing protein [Bacteroidales bacterium]|nr:DUF748 domain-containing protein [Bacteroidales bacterium]MDD4669721.1 DUF748 domain-containing protein [Bacteroidales bacterium]
MALKKRDKVLIWFVGIVVFIIAAVSIAASPIAKQYVENHDTELIGREVSIDKLIFNIFNGKLRFTDVVIFEADGKTPFMTLDTLAVQGKLTKLLNKEVIIRHAYIKSLDAKIIQNEKVLNLDDVIDFFTLEEDSSPSEWSVGLYDIKIRDGIIRYNDLALNTALTLNNLNLNVPGLYLSGTKETDAGIEFDLADNGHFKVRMAYGAQNSSFNLSIDIADLGIGIVKPYIEQSLNIGDVSGLLSANLVLQGDTEHFSQMKIFGNAMLNKFLMQDIENEELLSIDKVNVEIDTLDLSSGKYHFAQAGVSGINLNYTIFKDSTDNISKLLKSVPQDIVEENDTLDGSQIAEALDTLADYSVQDSSYAIEPATSEIAAAHRADLIIRRVDIDGVDIRYTDRTFEQPFEYEIFNLAIHSRNLNLRSRSNLKLTADIKGGKINALWFGNLYSLANQNLTVEILNLNLADFSPYCQSFTAYPIDNGVMTFLSTNEVRDFNLKSDNSLNIHGLDIGKKVKKMKPQVDVPLKAAVYILEDKDDRIMVDLPVTGNINSPEFSYKRLIFKTLGNLLVKVTLSPFEYLASSLGLSPDKLASIEIDPTMDYLTSEQTDMINHIRSEAIDKSQLQLVMEQRYNPDQVIDMYGVCKLKEDYYKELLRVERNMSRMPALTEIERKKAREIKNKDLDFMIYVQKRLDSLGMSQSKFNSVEAASSAIYVRDSLLAEISEMSYRRDSLVFALLRLDNAIVSTPVPDSLRGYNGKPEYKVNFVINSAIDLNLDLNEKTGITPADTSVTTSVRDTLKLE